MFTLDRFLCVSAARKAVSEQTRRETAQNVHTEIDLCSYFENCSIFVTFIYFQNNSDSIYTTIETAQKAIQKFQTLLAWSLQDNCGYQIVIQTSFLAQQPIEVRSTFTGKCPITPLKTFRTISAWFTFTWSYWKKKNQQAWVNLKILEMNNKWPVSDNKWQ